MGPAILVEQWFEERQFAEYELIIGAIGFEDRAIFVPSRSSQLAKRRVAWQFADRQVLSFERNLRWYQDRQFDVIDAVDEDSGAREIASRLAKSTAAPRRVLLDISSMTGARIAALLHALAEESLRSPIVVDCVYAIAKYAEPPSVVPPNRCAGPIHWSLAGWTNEPSLPSWLAVAVGYEVDKAIGAIELIQPKELVVLNPRGGDDEYHRAVEIANSSVWQLRPPPRVVDYDVLDGFETCRRLFELVSIASSRSRVIVLPLGPKIMSLCSIIVGMLMSEISIWRVSAGATGPAVQRLADGALSGVRLILHRSESSR